MSGRSVEHNHELIEKQCQKAIEICERHAWKQKAMECRKLFHEGSFNKRMEAR